MRRVACYAATSTLCDGEGCDEAFEPLERLVHEWLASKGQIAADAHGEYLLLIDGRRASLTTETRSTPHGRVIQYELIEPTDSGQFMTRLCFGGDREALAAFIELRAGGEDLRVKPIPVDARCPDIYRNFLNQREWETGATRVRTKALPFLGRQGAEALVQFINHKDRNLPFIAVSTIDTSAFVPGLAEALARDLTGLAVVGTLDEGASWGVTAALGREWSCYNQAVRLYWPTRGKTVSAYTQPLWTPERLLEKGGTSANAVHRLRNQLRRQLVAISTYTISQPAALTRIWQEAAESRLIELRARAEDQGEWQMLAEEYAKENAALSAQVAKLSETNLGLQDQVANLNLAFKYRDEAGDEAIPPEDEPVIDTVADAINAAKDRFGSQLIFGEDVAKGIATIAGDAGPPDKVFDYLRTLSEMTQRRREEGLGKDMIVWLSDQGVKASIESETTMNNSGEMRRRTWDRGDGQTMRFIKHLKPKDATSPDQCVRIYFEYDEAAGITIIGWVGRHP